MWVFDFDGVLIDSIDEVMISGYNAVATRQVETLSELPESFTSLFRANRCRVKNAPELVLLARWALEQMDTDSTDCTLSANTLTGLAADSSTTAAEREETFFSCRSKFMQRNKQGWLDLNRPFEPLWSLLCSGDPGNVYILTYKNRAAVLELCQHFGLAVPADNIYSGDSGTGKVENFERLFSRDLAKQYHFIDDSVRNLALLQSAIPSTSNLHLYFADWGYSSCEDRGVAAELGFDSYSLHTFTDLLKMGRSPL